MSNQFAKIFETDLGQVLVTLDDSVDDGPMVRFTVQPEGFGLCHTALTFFDPDEGHKSARHAFDTVTEQVAIQVRDEIFRSCAQYRQQDETTLQ